MGVGTIGLSLLCVLSFVCCAIVPGCRVPGVRSGAACPLSLFPPFAILMVCSNRLGPNGRGQSLFEARVANPFTAQGGGSCWLLRVMDTRRSPRAEDRGGHE